MCKYLFNFTSDNNAKETKEMYPYNLAKQHRETEDSSEDISKNEKKY